jgi:hypothetical protein
MSTGGKQYGEEGKQGHLSTGKQIGNGIVDERCICVTPDRTIRPELTTAATFSHTLEFEIAY